MENRLVQNQSWHDNLKLKSWVNTGEWKVPAPPCHNYSRMYQIIFIYGGEGGVRKRPKKSTKILTNARKLPGPGLLGPSESGDYPTVSFWTVIIPVPQRYSPQLFGRISVLNIVDHVFMPVTVLCIPYQTHYQFSIKTLLSNDSCRYYRDIHTTGPATIGIDDTIINSENLVW